MKWEIDSLDKSNCRIFTKSSKEKRIQMRDKLHLNTITNEDCRSFIPRLHDECIDIIIIDPPYAISSGNQLSMRNIKKQNGFGGDWNIINEDWDKISFNDYCLLIEKVIHESYRVLKPSGTMFVCGTYHNIGIINYFAHKTDFHIINEIIWYKRNAFPNLSKKCLTASHENILWLGKSTEKWNFNYDAIKKAIYNYDGLKEPNKQMRSVWDIPNNKKKDELAYRQVFTKSSYWIRSQKPLRLIDRCLEITAKPRDIVADWFAGSGTTLISALNHSLPFIGCEINPKFVEVIQWRLNQKSRINSKKEKE